MDLESLLCPNALNSKPRIRGKMRASQLPQTKEEIRSMALKVRSLPVLCINWVFVGYNFSIFVIIKPKKD